MTENIDSTDLRIVEANRIVGLLTRLMKEQVPLTLKPADDEPEWYGSIKEIEFHQGRFLVTPLNVGRDQNTSLADGCEVYGKLSGVAIHFTSDECNKDLDLGSDGFRLKYPSAIFYHQRRGSERVGVWVDQKVPVTLQLEGKIYLKGYLHDISAEGVSACFYRVITIQDDEISPLCLVDLPDGNKVGSKLEIKGVKSNKDGSQMNVRGKFLDMSPENQVLLQHFVKGLEKTLDETSI